MFFFFFFFNDTATTEIYTLHIVGSVRCVQETGIGAILLGQLISAIFSIIFFGNIGIFYVTFCILGALLAGFYFVYHTMLVRGVFNVKIDNDDYILAAMLLYVDLIELFLRILRLLIIIYKLKKK
eukprot:TRINITY_DN6313_c0_g1_i3.p1 TRINITY_DN6313_c0_g1~~TRINITY_DN6313_c0_g1_i3.p1  ORF type:complete len:125 (-),score=34.16 TRINITY_DN6313_c0_g1_i3:32-406(-)